MTKELAVVRNQIPIVAVPLLLLVVHAAAQPCAIAWNPLGSGIGLQNSFVSAMASFNSGSGPALYAFGSFTSAGGMPASGFASWDGSRWTAPIGGGGGGAESPANLMVFDAGSGPSLFLAAGGTVQRFTGTSFASIGAAPRPIATTLAVFNDGTGPALYAGGPVSAPYNGIGRWNGTTWSTVGGGVSGSGSVAVTVLGVYDDDGPGPQPPALYAGGTFSTAGGVPASGIAKWNGSAWAALGAGLGGNPVTPPVPPQPHSMAAYDDGSGPALYVSGYFLTAGGAPAQSLARWNGSAWSTNFGATFNEDDATAMQVFDDGSGPALFLAGASASNAGVLRYGIAKWNGVSWSYPSTNPDLFYQGLALAVYDSGSGSGLYDGGRFSSIGGISANRIARYGRPMCPANCDGTFNAVGCPSLSANDFQCFLNRFAAGDLRANCDGSTVNPIMTANDFQCFLNAFAAGCS